jgi:hypothetical protein
MTDVVERELQQIARVLETDLPVADPEFRARLDERVARRFEKEPRRRRVPSRRLFLAGASAVLALLVVVGALAGLNGSEQDQVVTDQAIRSAPDGAESTGDLASPTITETDQSAGVRGSAPAPAPARRVERTAQLTLAAEADRLGEVADRIVKVTDSHRGIVVNSSVSTGDDSGRGGNFELRIPTTQLTATMRDLSRLGEVRSRSETSQERSRAYDSLADRLTAARVERRGLLRRLAHADSTDEADRLRARLDQVAVEIRGLSGRLADLRERTDYTRVSVSLVEDSADEGGAGGGGSAGDALLGSLDTLVGASAIVLRVLAAALPFALLAALVWAVVALTRRRRREAVLS